MTKDDIIRMALEAGMPMAWISDSGVLNWTDLKHFAHLVAAAEREACAKLCLETEPFYGVMFYNAIRARGNT
jgi:imidazolonepropionase-like amidohydrolase